jgi:tRNA nucleotidyltransferase (CCA-adding enzyme)
MQIFLVGGSVRDELLGLPVTDRDWVVVGSSPEEMLALGFMQVGKDFPVFLHPSTHEQYALARIERKIAPGYYGFECVFSKKVSLEEDLQRRDLTINAIAKSQDGIIIDPFAGQSDLKQRVLRHVSLAFVEDPVRVLRVARFLARFADLGFSVAPETMALMRQMVANGELNSLVKERVWAEMRQALETNAPAQFFLLLQQLGALKCIALELANLDFTGLANVAKHYSSVMVRFGALAKSLQDKAQFVAFANNLGLPQEFKKFGLLCVRYQSMPANADAIYALFKELRIYNNGGLELLEQFLQAGDYIKYQSHLIAAYERSLQVNARSIQALGFKGAAITAELDAARIKLIESAIAPKI